MASKEDQKEFEELKRAGLVRSVMDYLRYKAAHKVQTEEVKLVYVPVQREEDKPFDKMSMAEFGRISDMLRKYPDIISGKKLIECGREGTFNTELAYYWDNDRKDWFPLGKAKWVFAVQHVLMGYCKFVDVCTMKDGR